MNFEQYLQSIKNMRVAVVGIGVSNTPLIKALLEKGIDVTACDRNPRESFGTIADEFESKGVKLQLGADYLENLDQDIIFRSPGIRPDIPQFVKAEANGAQITSEMEIFFEVCPCTIIAITGSDGKTTTTTLVSKLLEAQGVKVHVGGNIGTPLLCKAMEMKESDVAVLELSSFQLMRMKRSPHVAVITNLAPNHLDVHKDMQEYIDSKCNIFLHQQEEDILVLNADNELTAALESKAHGSVKLFSRKIEPKNGVFCRGDKIFRSVDGEERFIMNASDILIPGVHNIENYMAAIAAVGNMVSDENILKVARTFGGVEHRIELVRTLDGVRFYNDSIASSPSRTMAGLNSFDRKVILIAGGYDKHIPFEAMGETVCQKVKRLILTGDTAEKIRQSIESCTAYRENAPEIIMEDDFTKAVEIAAHSAEKDDIVILSPACASFDKFRNFAERGNRFKEIVMGLERI